MVNSAFDKALSWLSRRPYSKSELQKRLQKAKFPASEVTMALDECARLGLINDEIYAVEQARFLAERNYGRLKIKTKLIQHGVATHLESATNELESTELERACAALEYKLRVISKESDSKKKREKCLRFLLSRGFDMKTANQAWNEAKNSITGDSD